jgi:hypothetical protein
MKKLHLHQGFGEDICILLFNGKIFQGYDTIGKQVLNKVSI